MLAINDGENGFLMNKQKVLGGDFLQAKRCFQRLFMDENVIIGGLTL
ncbi:hypothetical protein ABU178_14970 [Pantoea osteomyelitidis]|uniref:Uncharacterized protein n=1 Tax=Pantoea osteomyelitidis TaxID=3230026 RepID=A0ABW7PYR7_9GAMM